MSRRSLVLLLLAESDAGAERKDELVGAGYLGGQWFGMEKFSLMFALVQCAASLFSAFNQNLLALAIARLEWRELCTWTGVLGVAVFAVATVCIRNPSTFFAPPRVAATKLIGELFEKLAAVARIPPIWLAAGFGALSFGALLAAGVVWAPKLMLARGLSAGTAGLSASVLWLGVAVDCLAIPWSSQSCAVGRRSGVALPEHARFNSERASSSAMYPTNR